MVERALTALAAMAELAGSFLARRLRAEAWPQLAQLLHAGPVLTRTPSMLPGEERHAPAVLQRARLAVLACLHTCASLGSCYMALFRVLPTLLQSGSSRSKAFASRHLDPIGNLHRTYFCV